MTNADYIRNSTDFGMAKEVLRISREICNGCCEGVCEGVENCVWFSERYGSPSLTDWLRKERKDAEGEIK